MPRDNKVLSKSSRFGRRVRRLRIAAGWTLARVAEKTGICAPILCRLETAAKCDPRLSQVVKLAKAFGVTVGHLAGEGTASRPSRGRK